MAYMSDWKSAFHGRRTALAFLILACVFVATHLPPDLMSKVEPRALQVPGGDKVEHACAYTLVTMSFLFAARWQGNHRLLVMVILGIAAIGAADELTQPLTKRDCSGWDWTADLVGISLACVIALVTRAAIARWRMRTQRRESVAKGDGSLDEKSRSPT
jgi:VanZ family protein